MTRRSTVTRSDITWCYAVYAFLDSTYAPDLPPKRVKITKGAAYELHRDDVVLGQWDGDILTLYPYAPAATVGSPDALTGNGQREAAQPRNEPSPPHPEGEEKPHLYGRGARG